MPDLDALIREDLNDDVLLSCSGGDHVDHTHYQATVNALRAVLDHIGQCEFFADELEGDDLRNIIARELGVKTDA